MTCTGVALTAWACVYGWRALARTTHRALEALDGAFAYPYPDDEELEQAA